MCPFSWAIFAIVAIGNNRKVSSWVQGLAPDKAQWNLAEIALCSLAYGKISQKIP